MIETNESQDFNENASVSSVGSDSNYLTDSNKLSPIYEDEDEVIQMNDESTIEPTSSTISSPQTSEKTTIASTKASNSLNTIIEKLSETIYAGELYKQGRGRLFYVFFLFL